MGNFNCLYRNKLHSIMQAIEFETTARNHFIRIPDNVPDGILIRVLLLVNDKVVTQDSSDNLKTLFTHVAEGLDETDFERIRDFGRVYEDNLKDNSQRLAKKWDVFFASKSVFDDDFLAERDNDIPQERKFY